MGIWFVLMMFHAGRVWWLGSFETYEECRVAQLRMEEAAAPGQLFACPAVKVEST